MSFMARSIDIPGLSILRLILCIGFLNEIISQIFKIRNMNDNISHYFYIPIEYLLLTLFFLKNIKIKILKKLMICSLFIYILIVLPIIFLNYEPLHFPYPSIIYNINCIFNILWISLILFNFENTSFQPIIRIPIFWILSGMLIFYSGIFFFNGAYNYFMNRNLTLAIHLRDYINITFNNLLYLIFLYAFYISWKKTKYSYQ